MSAHESLTDLYKTWVQTYQHRSNVYRERLDTAWENLQSDIQRWVEAKSENEVVSHHIFQFGEYTRNAFNALTDTSNKSSNIGKANDQNEALDFRALVIGVFTAQWFLLRNVAQQRIEGSPYREGIVELDTLVELNYRRLYHVLLPKFTDKIQLVNFAPLAYLGNAGELTIFNRHIPLMLSLPLAAVQGSRDEEFAKMAIPHEVSHAIFAQMPELLSEIYETLAKALQDDRIKSPKSGNELTNREIVLYRMTLEWIEEICADLLGTALEGEKYVQSARWTMLSSEETTGVTDQSHPPAIIRPLVHLLALEAIEEDGKQFTEIRNQFDAEISKASSEGTSDLSLHRRFRSVPALLYVDLDTVSIILTDVVERILAMPLQTLGEGTISALLREVHLLKVPPDLNRSLPPWGTEPPINSESFVLDFPAEIFPTYTTPGVSVRPDGWDIPIIRDILGLLRRR